ncbi:hypothetical protein TanjilG_20402 [Lupinus angustifolius]|uniref:GBF-interacting protein 1 N-terminal domain-containing protein n=1 Tax=Lupinus angustifolius TaxID=3871 RepID=A0A4P1RVZ5_LUPAN|nr:PREDICTED: uncharacterized protein LOC109348369 isoform X2 [Lupinus angustifolius]OIW19277.1 hypothetical protein TanjilG_20402 [Lupinus angustifolius]
MSGKGGSIGGGGSHINGGGGSGGGGSGAIPASSRKMVQSLKEIVKDMNDLEIYATLKDCNMDPDEAVNRLLSQDPFHEVKKTKRDKKKDATNDYYSRARPSNNNNYTRAPASARAPPRKVAPKIEHHSGTTPPPVYTLNNTQPPSYRSTDSVGVFDGVPSSTQHAPVQSSPWVGNPGQRSMADIVKMGKPQVAVNRPSNQQGRASKVSDTNHDEWPSIEHQSAVNEWPSSTVHEPDVNEWPSSVEHQPAVNEWPSSIEHQPALSASSVVDVIPNSEYYANSSNFGEGSWQQETYDNEYVAEEVPVENPDSVQSASASAKSKVEDNQEPNFYQDNDSYQPHRHPFDNNEAEDAAASSVAANFEQLKLHAENQGTESEEESPSVVIPDHLQLHTPECLNLSFGSFGCANNAALSESETHASRPLKNNLEDTSEAQDVSIIGSSDARNADYYGDEHLTTSSDGNLVQRTGVGAGTYERSSVSQSESLKSEPTEPVQENQYSFPSSSQVYTYENAQQSDGAFPHSQASSQLQGLSPFSSVMQAYTNSLPSALLGSTVQMAREDIPYSPFPVQQQVPAKYSNSVSSIGGATITMSEALRANSISTLQPNPQAQPGANVATGPALHQHLAVHPYSQPTLPLGHYANMIGYPFLPQSYTYMPSAYQQAFAQNSTYHQTLAALLPQYKNSISVSSLPQSAAIPPGYGFGSSTNVPGGNFPLNPPAAPTSTTIGYEDALNSQYKDNNHIMSLQQNENSPMLVHGAGSRTMSAAPPNAYYSIQGQNLQAGGFRQSQQQQQQPSQHFGPLGYPNFYQSQAGISLEHQQQQQQNPREASLAGPQGQQSKQTQQLWHNSY